jgi:hypothetical protein
MGRENERGAKPTHSQTPLASYKYLYMPTNIAGWRKVRERGKYQNNQMQIKAYMNGPGYTAAICGHEGLMDRGVLINIPILTRFKE